MEIPDWIKEHKKKGMEIRCFKNNYYAYKISSKWDKDKKRSKKITEKFLGKITPEGIIPPKADRIKQNLSIKEYGATFLIQEKNNDIIEALKEHFLDSWKEIFITSVFRFFKQSTIKNINLFYENSFLSEKFTKAHLTPKTITALLKKIGEKREKILAFCKKFVNGKEHILFDVTNMISNSKQMEINCPGYNSKNIYDPQINLLYIFSKDKNLPIYYRFLPGNIREIKAFKNSIKEIGLKKAVVIADKGFYSEENIKTLQEEELQYIIPLKRNSKLLKYEKIKKGNKQEYDGYFMYERRVIWYYSYEINNQKIHVFIDPQLKNQEERDYLNRLENSYDGYTQETFYKKQFSFGTIGIATNVTVSSEMVYLYLKERLSIEVMFDVFKNLLHADRTYMRNEKSLEGWLFINHLSLIYYYRFYHLLMKHDLLKKYSPKDLLIRLSQIKKIRIEKEWITSEITHDTRKLLQKLDIHIT